MLLEVQLGDATSDTETGWLVLGGLLIGATEWLVLSRRFPISGWWAIGFGAGWGVALKTGWLFGSYVPNIVWLGGGGGVLVGVQQWLALRRHIDRAFIWLPVFIARARSSAPGRACTRARPTTTSSAPPRTRRSSSAAPASVSRWACCRACRSRGSASAPETRVELIGAGGREPLWRDPEV